MSHFNSLLKIVSCVFCVSFCDGAEDNHQQSSGAGDFGLLPAKRRKISDDNDANENSQQLTQQSLEIDPQAIFEQEQQKAQPAYSLDELISLYAEEAHRENVLLILEKYTDEGYEKPQKIAIWLLLQLILNDDAQAKAKIEEFSKSDLRNRNKVAYKTLGSLINWSEDWAKELIKKFSLSTHATERGIACDALAYGLTKKEPQSVLSFLSNLAQSDKVRQRMTAVDAFVNAVEKVEDLVFSEITQLVSLSNEGQTTSYCVLSRLLNREHTRAFNVLREFSGSGDKSLSIAASGSICASANIGYEWPLKFIEELLDGASQAKSTAEYAIKYSADLGHRWSISMVEELLKGNSEPKRNIEKI